MFRAACQHQIADLNHVAPSGGNRERHQRITCRAEVIVVGQYAALGIEQSQDRVGFGSDTRGDNFEDQLLAGPRFESEIIDVSLGA